MLLNLSDAKRPTASLELLKAYKKSETSDCLSKYETSHSIESSQCTENS